MNIQDELGITFVVVTHDQEEAMILSSRIAVMDKGRFEQVGRPKEVYEYPASRFVADFIGNINIFEGTVDSVTDGRISVSADEADSLLTGLTDRSMQIGDQVCIAVRPEKIYISDHEPENKGDARLSGVVQDLGYFGNLSLYRIRLTSGKIVQVSAQNRRRSAERHLEWDDEVFISWRPRSAVVLTE
jgi:putrescine transport system ATP-binding protein